MSLKQLPLARVTPNPDQPRKHFDREALEELAGSIRALGVIQPISVRPHFEGFIIIAGERRYRAATIAGLQTIPAVVHNLSEADAFTASVAENVNRRDMTTMEEARAYAHLLAEGRTAAEVARMFGKGATTVQWRADLTNLVPEAQHAVDAGGLKCRLAWYMSQLAADHQRIVLRKVVRGGFRNEEEALAYVRGLSEIGLWETVEDPEARREQATRVRKDVSKHLDQLGKGADALASLDGIAPAALADALGNELQQWMGVVEHLKRSVSRAQIALQNAQGVQQAYGEATVVCSTATTREDTP